MTIQQMYDGSNGYGSSSDSSREEFIVHVQQLMSKFYDTAQSSRTYFHCDQEPANEVFMKDYFVDDPRHNANTFRKRFRMSKKLFLKLFHVVSTASSCFQECFDGRRKNLNPI